MVIESNEVFGGRMEKWGERRVLIKILHHTFASIQDPIYHLKGFSYKLRASLYTLHTNPKYGNLLMVSIIRERRHTERFFARCKQRTCVFFVLLQIVTRISN